MPLEATFDTEEMTLNMGPQQSIGTGGRSGPRPPAANSGPHIPPDPALALAQPDARFATRDVAVQRRSR